MLFYVRLITTVIFAIIIGGVYIAGGYFQSLILSYTIEPSYTQQSTNLVNTFYDNVWKKYPPEKNGQLFDEKANELIRTQNVLKFFVHKKNGDLFYTTNNRRIQLANDEDYSKHFYAAANKGLTNITILPNVQYRNQDMSTTKGDLLRIMLPLQAQDKTAPEAVALIYYDVTYALSKLTHVHMFITYSVAAIALILLITLFIISYSAERVINIQEGATHELRTAKERAEAQNKEKSEFLANISHELRTPLNAIIGFSDIIRGELLGNTGNPQYKEYAEDIHTSGVHLLSLINDILDFSKAEAGKLNIEMADMDLTKAVLNSLRIIEPKATESQIKLVKDIPEEHIVVRADAKRLKQVILNLLSNAVKFTPENGEVKLILEENKKNILIEIRDSGIGISAKDIAKAMSSFGQIDSSLSRKHDGTGLGLPFSKRLVEMMGGTFTIKSEDTLGTSVSITFPKPPKEDTA